MLCFRDRTYCDHFRDCAKADTCSRPLTDQVKADAQQWWGDCTAPIAVFAEQPDCHVKKEDDGAPAEG